MQSLEISLFCTECSKAFIDAGDEMVCPSCGIVKEKEVVEFRSSRAPVATDFTRQALGSYIGTANVARQERFSKGFSRTHSSYRYLKKISDYIGRDDGAAFECAKMIERVSEKLFLPRMVMVQAVVIAKRLLASKLCDRRVTLAAVSAYSLIVSCKVEGVNSVSTKEVLEAHRSLGRRVKVSSIIQISLESEIKVGARRPEEYLSRVIAKLSQNAGLSRALATEGVVMGSYFRSLRELAGEVLALVDEDSMAGRRPCALAATAIYAADLILAARESRGRRITQRDVAACGDTAEYTVREQYRQIFTPSLSSLRHESRPNRPVLLVR